MPYALELLDCISADLIARCNRAISLSLKGQDLITTKGTIPVDSHMWSESVDMNEVAASVLISCSQQL